MTSFISKAPAHDALAETNAHGHFVRTAAGFREIISKEHSEYKPEFDRYHLYISLACPWANRCLAVLKMKGLDACIKHTVVHPTWQRTRPDDDTDTHAGWAFFQSGLDATSWYVFAMTESSFVTIGHICRLSSSLCQSGWFWFVRSCR